MAKTKIIILVCFLAAFVAGTTTGLVAGKSSDHRPRGRSWMMSELNLIPQQREQMRDIWAKAMDFSAREFGEQRRAISEERDKAVVALLTPEQQPKYEQIRQEYSRKLKELADQRKAGFDRAVEETKKILTPEQARQYDELLKKPRERGAGGSGRPMPWGGVGDEHRGPHGRRGGGQSQQPATNESQAPHVEE
jgi:Spy/CpxP family protein refolding chaperone